MSSVKKILSTLAIILVCNHVFATIRTCSNNNTALGQYTLSAAIGASANYDTVYVSGSLLTYNEVIITKPITLIGTGFNPQKQNPLVSRMAKLRIFSDEVNLVGLEVDSIKFDVGGYECFAYNCLINNIKVEHDNSTLGLYGCIVKNSFVLTCNIPKTVCINSIIYPQIQFLSSTSVVLNFRNCIFLYPGNFMSCSGTYDPYEGCYNNIFYGSVADITGGTPNPSGTGKGNFHHNVSYPSVFPDDDGNNIVANPFFVNVPAPPVAFSLNHNFHLQPTSPALLNLGDNANQRGIYSTFYPQYIFRDNGIPAIPTIQTMSVTPTTVLSGQSIQVNFSSKTNQ